MEISKEDLELILRESDGNRMFTHALHQIKNPSDLLRAISCYIQFNSVFGSGVANLAGEIAARPDLFRDTNEEVDILLDRSYIVAAEVFSAAIDEYGDYATPNRSTHRSLAQATLKGIIHYFNYSPNTLKEVVCKNEATSVANRKVCDGYGINQVLDDQKIFHSIGFHMASEILADGEFNILNNFLRDKYPALVKYLENTTVEIGSIQCPAYHWINIHTKVESEHFSAAMKAANKGLFYYAGPESSSCIKGWILGGFKGFITVQTGFMADFME